MLGITNRGCDGFGPRELEDQVNSLKVFQSFLLVSSYVFNISCFYIVCMITLNCEPLLLVFHNHICETYFASFQAIGFGNLGIFLASYS